MSDFDDIRPYRDDEVATVLNEIVRDPELIELIGQFKYTKPYKYLPFLVRPLIQLGLQKKVKSIHSVSDFQHMVETYMTHMLNTTTDKFTVSGIEYLDTSQSYLFVSNHRDITMDPALTNYSLYHNGFGTLRIAIGDNLLTKAFASDLMRLNKSFIVKRSITKPRELLRELTRLSKYIDFSLNEEHENIWIAHREGRAKDGMDKSDPAIIKMFSLAKGKKTSLTEYLKSLRIVPLSISYEYDPCDVLKANELEMSEHGEYKKAKNEDLNSIGEGIQGYKGRVHLAYGKVIDEAFEDTEAVAKHLDREIIANYRIYPSNLYAYFKVYGEDNKEEIIERLSSDASVPEKEIMQRPVKSYDLQEELCQKSLERFEKRYNAIADKDKKYFLDMYANPVVNKLNFYQSNIA